jgi:parvulin-like peptidyl-prolyl isomerase
MIKLLLLLFGIGLSAAMIDGIAAVVNNEPITMYEIEQAAKRLHISPKEALELLIQKRIEESQIKKLGIDVDDFELEKAIENFAAQKGMDLASFRQAIESQGVSWSDYKRSFKEQLLRKRLYERIARDLASNITEEQLRDYYENHKNEFTLAKKATLYKYISPSKEILERIRQNPLYTPQNPALLAKGEEKVDLETLEPTFAAIINKTPEGGFTPILPLPNDDRYLLILVKSKEDRITIPFEKAKGFILNKLSNKNRSKSVKEYFDKLRASANVKIIRMP